MLKQVHRSLCGWKKQLRTRACQSMECVHAASSTQARAVVCISIRAVTDSRDAKSNQRINVSRPENPSLGGAAVSEE